MKKISLAKLEGFLKARCDDLRAAGLDATEYRDYIIAIIFLKRVNDTFEKEQQAYVKKLKREYPDFSEEELLQEAEENNSDVYEFYVPVEARWKVAALPIALHREMSEKYSEAKGKLEGQLNEVERIRYQQQFEEAERMLNWHGIIEEKTNVGAVVTRALKAIEDSNGHFLFGVLSEIKFDEVDGKGERKLPDEIVTNLVNDFNEIVSKDNLEDDDIIGDKELLRKIRNILISSELKGGIKILISSWSKYGLILNAIFLSIGTHTRADIRLKQIFLPASLLEEK